MTDYNNVEVTRTISKVEEMTLRTGKHVLKGEVESREGAFRSVSNGSVTDAESGTYMGSFSAQGPMSLNVSIQGASTRAEREGIYNAVESFKEGAVARVESENTMIE